MKPDYVISKRTPGANPFLIFESLNSIPPEFLRNRLRSMQYPAFLETAYWFAVSSVAKSRAGMRCQVCNSPTGIQVHHRTYDTHGAEHSNMNDLVVLCEFCHGLFHGHMVEKPNSAHRHGKLPKNRKGVLQKEFKPEDIKVPAGDKIILTMELIDACRANGSFTHATIHAFGVTRATMTAGWPERLVGKEMTPEQYKACQEARFTYRFKMPR